MRNCVVLIGCGAMGKRHRERLRRRNCEFLAELDSSEAVEEFMNAWGETYSEKKEKPILLIASPATTHYEYAKRGLQLGFDVFVEKPLALNTNEANDLISLALERKRILFPGHSEHYHSQFAELQKSFSEFWKPNAKISFFRHNLPSNRGLDVSVAFDLLVHDLELFFALAKNVKWEIVQVKKEEHFIELELLCEKSRVLFSVNRKASHSKREIVMELEEKKKSVSFLENAKWDALEKEHEHFFESTFDSLLEEQNSALLAVKVASMV